MHNDYRPLRLSRVRETLTDHHLDALLVTSMANIRYLTGFSGSSALLLITQTDFILITDFRYETQVAEEVGDFAQVAIDGVSLWNTLFSLMAGMSRVVTIGFESPYVSHRDFERFLDDTQGRPWVWRPQAEIIEIFRASKDDSEIALIEEAARVATLALHDTLARVRPGITERQVAGILEHALRDHGSETLPFESIVASGPRAALPHARPGPRELRSGDLLLLDFGAVVEGYCSDITRTVVVGKADERQREIYGIVRSANELVLEQISAGMSGREVDAIARDYISSHGYGDDFGHSLGHGIGLEIHEAPRLAKTAEGLLPLNTVVTVEPGIYQANWGGVRIEDDVLLGAEGSRILTDFTHDLLELSA